MRPGHIHKHHCLYVIFAAVDFTDFARTLYKIASQSAPESRIVLMAWESTLYHCWYSKNIKMFRQYQWLFAFIILCHLIAIRCESEHCKSAHEVCVERHFYDNADNTSFAFRWIFSEKSLSCRLRISFDVFCNYFKYRYKLEDGSVALGSGELINGDEHRLQRGHFRFNIREQPYEFKYEIDESVDHCSLSKIKWNSLETERFHIQVLCVIVSLLISIYVAQWNNDRGKIRKQQKDWQWLRFLPPPSV